MSFALKGLLLLTYLSVTFLVEPSAAKPTDGYKQNSYVPRDLCIEDEAKLYVCQKCAKLTKSNRVYPDCCNERDGVYRWCFNYVHFGVSPH